MKPIRKILVMLISMTIILSVLSVPSLASSKLTIVPLSQGKWYKVPEEGNEKYAYKLTLKADSILTIKYKDNKTRDTYIDFCKDKNDYENSLFLRDHISLQEKRTYNMVLSKGTYYLRLYDSTDGTTTQVLFTTKKAVYDKNYRLASAKALKANKTESIIQTIRNDYDRWYKVKLTKKKKISITTTDEYAEYVQLYNSDMESIECAYGSKTVVSEDKLPKGTYYILITARRGNTGTVLVYPSPCILNLFLGLTGSDERAYNKYGDGFILILGL